MQAEICRKLLFAVGPREHLNDTENSTFWTWKLSENELSEYAYSFGKKFHFNVQHWVTFWPLVISLAWLKWISYQTSYLVASWGDVGIGFGLGEVWWVEHLDEGLRRRPVFPAPVWLDIFRRKYSSDIFHFRLQE